MVGRGQGLWGTNVPGLCGLATGATRQEAPSASAGMRVAWRRWRIGSPGVACSPPGDFATGCPLGRLGVARESQRFPGVCACHPRLLTIGNRFDHPCAAVPVRKPLARARGIRVASRRCRTGSPGVTCSPPGDFATGCPRGRRGVARESQTFPGVCACHPRLLTIRGFRHRRSWGSSLEEAEGSA